MTEFVLQTAYITLGQLLKATGQVEGGGEVKELLAAGTTLVNGEPETRRGRKLRVGDVVEFAPGDRVRLVMP